jgi:ABC-2 type transport system permease protein
MISSLKHYLGVYRYFVTTSVSEALSFRTSFMLLIMMDIFFYFSVLFSVDFLFDHMQTIGPWTKYQLLFFISFMLNIDAIHMGVFSSNFWMLGFKIRTGELDFDLLKPTHSIFICFFRYLKPSSLITAPVAWAMLIYYGSKIGLLWYDWLLIPPLILLGLSLLCVLEFILSTSMFWLVEGMGVNFLRMQMQQMARWPDFIYKYTYQKIFTIAVPVLLIGSGPVHFILDKSNWHYLVGMFVALFISSLILIKIWNKALCQYDSASS